MVYSVGDSFMESFIIYVKILTYAIGHPEEFYQETYIIKAPTDDKSKEEKLGANSFNFCSKSSHF